MNLEDNFEAEREKVKGVFYESRLQEVFDNAEFSRNMVNSVNGLDSASVLSLPEFPLYFENPIFMKSSFRHNVFTYPNSGLIFKTGVNNSGFSKLFNDPKSFSLVVEKARENEHALSEYLSIRKELREGYPVVAQHAVLKCVENGYLYIAEELGESLSSIVSDFGRNPVKFQSEGEATFLALENLSKRLSYLGIDYRTPTQMCESNPQEILNRLIRFDRGEGNYEILISGNPIFRKTRVGNELTERIIYDAMYNLKNSFEEDHLANFALS